MKYKNLVFDLYGTLVDIHTDQSKPEVWEKTALYMGFYGAHYSPGELRAEYEKMTGEMSEKLLEEGKRQDHAGQTYECFPELQLEKVFGQLFEQRGVTADSVSLGINAAQVFRLSSMEYVRTYPDVQTALLRLRNKGHKLWLLSNAQRVFTAYEMRALGIDGLFNHIYISSDYGCRKPDRRFFEVLLAGQKLNPSDCLMVGNDLTTDIGGAKAAGMATFYMHSNLSPADDCLETCEESRRPDYFIEGSDWKEICAALENICG